MPRPTRIELIGGGKKKMSDEIKLINKQLRQEGIRPIIKREHTGGKDPIRLVELRAQKGKQTVFQLVCNI